MKYYVIAGTFFQYKEYKNLHYPEMLLNRQIENVSDIVYVTTVDTIKGVSNPNGIFIGTWYNRSDIGPILLQLLISSTTTSKQDSIKSAMNILQDLRDNHARNTRS